MSCNVNGKGYRLCPGVWIAAALVFASLFQSFFYTFTREPFADSGTVGNSTAPGLRS